MSAVFCDGACINNGRPGARASIGIAVYMGPATTDPAPALPTKIYAECLPVTQPQTNQRAELYALWRTTKILDALPVVGPSDIYTDSMYAINCTAPRPIQADVPAPTKIWAPGWKARGWHRPGNKPIDHIDIIRPIFDWLTTHPDVTLHHIRAHQDAHVTEWPYIGNAIADWATWYARSTLPPIPASPAFAALYPQLKMLTTIIKV